MLGGTHNSGGVAMKTQKRTNARRALTVTTVSLVSVMLLASVAVAGVTWSPVDSSRTFNRPRTCTTPTLTCTDSAYSITGASPSFAVSNNGTTHYLHALWFSDHFGDSSGSYADYTTACSPNCAGMYYARRHLAR